MKIKAKLITSYLSIVIFSITLVSLPIFISQLKQIKNYIVKNSEAQLNLAKNSIQLFFSNPSDIVSGVEPYINSESFNLDDAQKDFQKLIDNNSSLACLYYIDEVLIKDGGKAYSSDGWIPEAEYNQFERDWYKRAMNSNIVIITDPYVDEDTKDLVCSISKKIQSKDNVFKGVAAIDIHLKELSQKIQSIKITDKGKSFLIDKNGYYLTNESADKINKVKLFDDYPMLASYKDKMSSSDIMSINASKEYYFMSTKISDQNDWYFVSIGNKSELIKISRLLRIIIMMAIITVCLTTLICVFISSTIVKPLKIVKNAINGIAEGNADLTQRLKVTTNDEVGELVNGFNKFMEKLNSIIIDVKDSKENLTNIKNDLQNSIDSTASSITQILSNVDSVVGQVEHQSGDA